MGKILRKGGGVICKTRTRFVLKLLNESRQREPFRREVALLHTHFCTHAHTHSALTFHFIILTPFTKATFVLAVAVYPPIFLSDPGLPLLPDSLTHRP